MNPQPVPEHAARGETARLYHEIRQTLRVSGVNLNFRTRAAFPREEVPVDCPMCPGWLMSPFLSRPL